MTILVTGATGNVGRLVVDHLLGLGATDVRALTNHPERANLPPEVDIREGFVGRPETVRPALEGVELLYLAPYARTVQHVVGLARDAGVRHIVDLSSTEAVREAAGDPGGWYYYAVERAVEDIGIDWTHLRPGEFMTNALIWADEIRSTGAMRSGYGRAATAMIDLDDIAAVAARILMAPDLHRGRTYQLSGPEAVSRADIARLVGEAIGKPVHFEELSQEEALAELSKTMGEYAQWYLDGLAYLAEHPEQPVNTVEAITGRPATPFGTWAKQHVSEFS